MDLFRKHQDQQGRGLTYDLWKNFPLMEIMALRDLNVGYGVFPNLASFDSAVDAAAGTVRYGSDGARTYEDADSYIKQLKEVGGGLRIFNTTNNEEAWIQWGGDNGAPFRISDAAGEARELVFEAAIRFNTVADDKGGFFIGLGEEGLAAADTIVDAGTLADKDLIGFFRAEGDGDAIDIVYRKAGQALQTVKADWKTIAADTWYHVGFRYHQKNRTVKFWFGTGDRSTTIMDVDTDNTITAADIAAATFPDAELLAPLAGGKSASADDTYMDVRLLACGQLAPAAD